MCYRYDLPNWYNLRLGEIWQTAMQNPVLSNMLWKTYKKEHPGADN